MTEPAYSLIVAAVVATGGSLFLCACSDRPSEESCYPRDSAPDSDPSDPFPPYCRWPSGELPEPPDGFEFTRKVFVAFEPTEDAPCDPCDLERFDAMLRAKIEEECNTPYELVRGCYAPSEETSNGSCWVEGLYYSNCDPGG